MKLETQFTVPHKELKDLHYVKKVDFQKKLLKKNAEIIQIKKIAQFVAIKNRIKIVFLKNK